MQDLITVINLHSGRVVCDDLYQKNVQKCKIVTTNMEYNMHMHLHMNTVT